MKHAKIKLRDAFKEINRQTGYHYLWSAQKVKSNTTIAVDIENQPLENAIQSVIKGLQLGYELDGKLIIIKEKSKPVANQVIAHVQTGETDATIRQAHAEALFLRAFTYFNLVRLYGMPAALSHSVPM